MVKTIAKLFKTPTTARQKAQRAKLKRTFTNTLPAVAVFGVAAYQSYWHTVHVALAYGQDAVSAHIMPIGTDGLFVVCANFVTAARTRMGRNLAIAGVFIAMATTLGFNLAAAPGGLGHKLVSLTPAVGMIVAALVMHYATPHRKMPAKKATKATASKTSSNVKAIRQAAA